MILLLAVAGGLLWPRLPVLGDTHSIDLIPLSGRGFMSREIPLAPFEIKQLGAARGIKRMVQSGEGAWVLAVTDGSLNRQAVHDPAYCFVGAGWKLLGRKSVPFVGGSASLLHLEKDGRSMDALVWFAAPGILPFDSMPEYWLRSTLRRISRGLSGPEPLLFILRPSGESAAQPPEKWLASAAGLAAALQPSPAPR